MKKMIHLPGFHALYDLFHSLYDSSKKYLRVDRLSLYKMSLYQIVDILIDS